MTNFARIYKTNSVTDEALERIKHTVLYTILPNLLNALMITKLNLDLITSLLPYIQDFASILSQVQGPAPKLVNGIGQVKEVYESDHNYPDYANQTHEIKVPNASKYVLTFDP